MCTGATHKEELTTRPSPEAGAIRERPLSLPLTLGAHSGDPAGGQRGCEWDQTAEQWNQLSGGGDNPPRSLQEAGFGLTLGTETLRRRASCS